MNAARRGWAGTVLVLALAGVLARLEPGADAQEPPAAGKQEHAAAAAALELAEQAVKSNDLSGARQLLLEFPEAHGTGDAKLEARRVFQLAVIDQVEAERGSPEREALLRRAAAGYSRVVEMTPGAAAALYNLGRAHQQLGNPELAAEAYQIAAAQPGKDQAFYMRHWADYLGSVNRWHQAEAAYEQVVFLQPRSEEPHRILSERYMDPAQRSALLGYLWQLVARQQSERAEDLALAAMERGQPASVQAELLTVVASSLGQRVRAPADLFDSKSGPRLAALADDPEVGSGVRQLLDLYRSPGSGPVGAVSWWDRRHLEWPDERGVPRADAIRAVLRGIGDGYRERGEAKIAATCYQAAVDASPGSPDPRALRELAGLYVEQNRLQDLNQLAARYADLLFEGKNERYRTGELETVLQYHRALGQIYGALALHSKASWGDTGTPTTALFQLRRAYDLGRTLDREQSDLPGPRASHVDPELAVLLAKALEAQGNAAAGIDIRLEAAEHFTSHGDLRAKDKVLRDIPTSALTPGQVERYQRHQVIEEPSPYSTKVTPVAPKPDAKQWKNTVAPVLVAPAYQLEPAAAAAGARKVVEVPANVSWHDTGIDVREGQRLALKAAGKWSTGGPQPSGPGGAPAGRVKGRLLAPVAMGSLIAKLGDSTFLVGESWSGPAPASGRLFLSINDAAGAFEDNRGSLQVAVTAD